MSLQPGALCLVSWIEGCGVNPGHLDETKLTVSSEAAIPKTQEEALMGAPEKPTQPRQPHGPKHCMKRACYRSRRAPAGTRHRRLLQERRGM